MKSLFAFAAIVMLSSFTPNLHADPLLTLQAGAAAGTLVETSIAGVDTYTYTHATTDILQTTDQTFTAVFTDVAGVNLLNVTDLCVNVDILAPAKPCQALAFSVTNLGLGSASLLTAVGAVGTNISGDAIGVNFDASIGGGSAEFGFGGNPPAPPSDSPVPEPGSLALLGTGALGIAGAVRRRFLAA